MQAEHGRRGILLCLVGPAGGGKTSHSEQLIRENSGSLSYSISATSRAPRAKEVNGVHYHFLTTAEFKERVAAGLFFESEVVHGNLYGTLRSTLHEAIDNGKDLVLDVDIRGALTFKKAFPLETVVVFLVPPSSKVLRERILARGSVTEAELTTRLETARFEYQTLFDTLNASQPPLVDYFVINDNRQEAYNTLSSILQAERHRIARLKTDDLRRLCSLDH